MTKQNNSVDELLFVYGNLKLGFDNNYLLKDAILVDRNAILQGYAMYLLINKPGIVECQSHNAYGELYKVNNAILTNLDILENPSKFFRQKLYIKSGISYVHSWVFIYNSNLYNKKLIIKSGKWSHNSINEFFSI